MEIQVMFNGLVNEPIMGAIQIRGDFLEFQLFFRTHTDRDIFSGWWHRGFLSDQMNTLHALAIIL